MEIVLIHLLFPHLVQKDSILMETETVLERMFHFLYLSVHQDIILMDLDTVY